MLKVKTFGKSDVGRRRKQNEDRFLINDPIGLYVVADGMGGHRGGAFASELAVETIRRVMETLAANPRELAQAGLKPTDYTHWISHAIGQASKAVHQRAKADPSLNGMGTTIVAMLLREDKAVLGHVGDSRGYLIREGKIRQITEDHSLVSEQVKAGLLSPTDARSHKFKNIITRSVGFQPVVDVDIDVKRLKFNDSILLCSDGLTNMLDDPQILEIVEENANEEVCDQLIGAANAQGGEDNSTVILVVVEEGDPLDEPTIELAD